MKKRLVSLLMALALCLSLLPATALAADGIEIYVGGQRITESGCYENQSGTWTKVDGTEPANGQFSYDAATATLTLNQAKIVNYQNVTVGGGFTYPGSVIAFSQSADVSLKIVVSQGTSNITGTGGIRVVSKAGDASLSISGPGSLEVNVDRNDSGITLIGSKNVNLNIDGADVKTLAAYYYGVDLHAGDGFKAAAVVNNGKLTAGGSGGIGIYYRWTNPSDSGTSSLTVSGNAVVDTRDSKILIASQASEVQVSAGSDGNGGIVFDGKSGTVYGDVTLQDDLTINEGETLTIGEDASLTVPEGKTLTSNGTIINNGTVTVEEGGTCTNNGSLDCNHHFGGTATCTEKAKCDLCGAEFGDFLPHSLTKTEAKAPTCTEDGNEAYWTCGTCGKYFSDGNGNTEITEGSWIISAINHDWNDAVYTWSVDGSTCTATRTCKHDSAHTETAVATVTPAQTKAPTCTENGETTYTAVFEADWAVTQTKVLTDIPAAGHKLTKTEAKAPTCTEPGNEAYWTCETCGKYFSDAEGKTEITLDSTVLPALGHDYKDGVCTRCDGKDPDYVPPTDPEAPAQTGESALLPLMAVLMIFSAAALLWTARKKQQF